ncbi:hypothetical protein THASP1DRAFT_34876 [Thamnocephalis sphaerospora]|uniref:Fumarylacetoacetase-like C-terminal domain-containing protein n=1 Tax=Thamnocephalis sphaerospora TaxID=78915 RepID=A0A4P9XQ11_9FUNG|nr:hypothetical protein THASP1DRAFT_34876 [Thamnocephalis sphaerospora]|eukprot:RKP07551.1 hypothetical protein THASP1DRAFT_34876 [Thamnocephalis sphaerospora]
MSARNFITAGRKIVAIGRNFSEHAKELGNAVPAAPFFFLKPTSSYVQAPNPIEIPQGCEVHHEVELGVVIGQQGRDIRASEADQYVAGYALAVDMTARNLQNIVKAKGLPWSAAKGFDTFTPIGDFIPKSKIADASNVELWLKLDDQLRQSGNTRDMIFNVPQLIESVSSVMRLEPGDLILTGTPKGVSQVTPGQILTAGLRLPSGETLSELRFEAVERQGLFRIEDHV